jgi:hypothetical protein
MGNLRAGDVEQQSARAQQGEEMNAGEEMKATSADLAKAVKSMPAGKLVISALSAALAWLIIASPGTAFAQKSWKPDRPVEIIVGTDPGSGFDRTARLLQKIWQTTHLVEQPVTVVNKAGGFGAIGWAYMNQRGKSGNMVAIMSPLLLTNNRRAACGRSAFHLSTGSAAPWRMYRRGASRASMRPSRIGAASSAPRG